MTKTTTPAPTVTLATMPTAMEQAFAAAFRRLEQPDALLKPHPICCLRSADDLLLPARRPGGVR